MVAQWERLSTGVRGLKRLSGLCSEIDQGYDISQGKPGKDDYLNEHILSPSYLVGNIFTQYLLLFSKASLPEFILNLQLLKLQ